MMDSPRPVRALHLPVRPEWLALTLEEAIDAGRPIVDAHHHLWDKPGARYMRDEMLEDSNCGHNIVATVFAEGKFNYRPDGEISLRSLGETEMAAHTAEESLKHPGAPLFCAGIVGFVDLTLGTDAGTILDQHIIAGAGRFRGVRNTSAWHANPNARGSVLDCPPGLLYGDGFRAGLAELSSRNLVFDAWMYHTQLGELVEVARAFPTLRIVINHQGGPIGIGPYACQRSDVFDDWSHSMARLARFDNVCVKLGGFGMAMSGFDFADHSRAPSSDALSNAWGPYISLCIEKFGASRCMFESNFPVDKGTASYGVLWNAFKKAVQLRLESEKDALFFRTAADIYALNI